MNDSMHKGPRGFATTRWSRVVAASRAEDEHDREALEQLCQTYWPPVYAFARRKTRNVEEARDVTQAFFERFLDKRWYASADPERGRFRTFLLTLVTRFLANEDERERAEKRGGGRLALSLDMDEEGTSTAPVDDHTPEREFDRRWAATLLERVLAQLERELEAEGRGALFERLRSFLAAGDETPAYETVASELSLTQAGARVAVFRLRRRYRDLLRATIADTVEDPSAVDAGIGGFHPPTSHELAPRFPVYEILGLIGQGGMGAVYRARHRELGRDMALKILRPELASDAALLERFTREGLGLARLNHPGIVAVHDFGVAKGSPDVPYVVMEYVDGPNLRQVLRSGKLPADEALALVPQICAALQ